MNFKLNIFYIGFIIDDILFPIQSLITRLNSQRLSVVTRAWAAYAASVENMVVDFELKHREFYVLGDFKRENV